MSAGLIFKKIADVMADIEAVDKSKDNKSQGFKFRGIDQFYNMLHPKLAKHRIFSVPEVVDERREERPTKSGGVMTHVILRVKYSLIAEDGSSISGVVIGEGSDTGDKAANKAMSIAHKYFLIQTFAVPTEDMEDPDAQSPEFAPKAAPPTQQPRAQAASMNQPARKSQPVKASDGVVHPGDHVIKFGTKEKGYLGMTIAQAVDRDGGPAVEHYINRLIDNNVREKKEVPQCYLDMRDRLNEFKMTRTAPPPPPPFGDEKWPGDK